MNIQNAKRKLMEAEILNANGLAPYRAVISAAKKVRYAAIAARKAAK